MKKNKSRKQQQRDEQPPDKFEKALAYLSNLRAAQRSREALERMIDSGEARATTLYRLRNDD